jgi:predicted RNA-binding Zn-ribbon protein involved in translation (DUF1610 family)
MKKYLDVFHPLAECQFCHKEMTVQNLDRHTQTCSKNPEVIDRLKSTEYTCEKCGKTYNMSMSKSIRFCSRSCSSSYSISNYNFSSTKSATCNSCGKEIIIKKNASSKRCKCETCSSFKKIVKDEKIVRVRNKTKDYTCSICGRNFGRKGGAHGAHFKSCSLKHNGSKLSYNYHRKDIRDGYIYLIENKINNKIYIGKKKGNPDDSLSYFGSGISIKRAIDKYGKDNFSKTILERISNGDLNECEKYWINFYKSNIPSIGYNLTPGGDGGPLFVNKKHTDETKEKLRIAGRRRSDLCVS